MGAFGGHDGRALRAGDTLTVGADPGPHEDRPDRDARAAIEEQPSIGHRWEVAVTEGPHGAPEFFTRADIDTLLGTDYTVHFNSDRTGVRLEGPKPQWARTDGGEAGLHPSNIHDNAYSVGALDFTGDTPILLGPDGPSLGGFVCPVTVVGGDRWKLGQMAPGDTVRFVPVRADRAPSLRTIDVDRRASFPLVISTAGDGDDGVLSRFTAERRHRRDAAALRRRRRPRRIRADGTGSRDARPGARARRDAARAGGARRDRTDPRRAVAAGAVRPGRAVDARGDRSDRSTSTPICRPPTNWWCRAARCGCRCPGTTRRRTRPSSATCTVCAPMRRGARGTSNSSGGSTVSTTCREVYDTVFDAQYLVLGLGDVYLGAPVATPLDPRHRLVTTKYNPARTWTPENAVGIGGAYLCIYGMEGPGGYQFVGRTTQVWNHCHPLRRAILRAGHPVAAALLRPDQLLPGQRRGARRTARRHGGGPRRCRHHRRRVLDARVPRLPRPRTRSRSRSSARSRARRSPPSEQAWGRAGEFTGQVAS